MSSHPTRSQWYDLPTYSGKRRKVRSNRERVVVAALEAAALGVDLEQPVDGTTCAIPSCSDCLISDRFQ